jgi:hypothetical protein
LSEVFEHYDECEEDEDEGAPKGRVFQGTPWRASDFHAANREKRFEELRVVMWSTIPKLSCLERAIVTLTFDAEHSRGLRARRLGFNRDSYDCTWSGRTRGCVTCCSRTCLSSTDTMRARCIQCSRS